MARQFLILNLNLDEMPRHDLRNRVLGFELPSKLVRKRAGRSKLAFEIAPLRTSLLTRNFQRLLQVGRKALDDVQLQKFLTKSRQHPVVG